MKISREIHKRWTKRSRKRYKEALNFCKLLDYKIYIYIYF